MKNPLKLTLSALTIAALALSLSACSPDKPNDSKTSKPTPVVTPTPLLAINNPKGGNTQLTLSKKLSAEFKSAGVKEGASGSATYARLSDGVGFSFVISGGNVSYYNPKARLPEGNVLGSVQHSGSAFTLTKGSTKLVVQDLVVTPGVKGFVTGDIFLNGKSVGNDELLFNVDGSTIKPLTQDSTGKAYISGYKIALAATLAKELNSAFKSEAFAAKESAGTLALTLPLPKGRK